MKKICERSVVLVTAVLIILAFCVPVTRQVQGRTWIVEDQTLTITAVDGTILDGTTSGRTYMAADRVALYSVPIDDRTDWVEIHLYSTGSDTADDTAKINIYGYGKNGPAMRIYEATTFTLGTAVSPGSGLYADTISGTDKHTETVEVADSGDNTVCKLKIDTAGLRWLYFEPETFTGITNVIIKIRSYGFKQ
jgi:hypothetical protein